MENESAAANDSADASRGVGARFDAETIAAVITSSAVHTQTLQELADR